MPLSIGLRTRLALAFAGLALLIVVVMTIASQIAFRADFRDYFRDRQSQPVATLADRLGDRHARTGMMPADPREWRALVSRIPGPMGHMASRMPRAIGLFNAEREPIAWRGEEPPQQWHPIRSNGETVGWVGFTPMAHFSDRPAERFQQRQLLTALAIAAAMLTLAGLIGLLIAINLLRPVTRLQTGTEALAAGDYCHRLPTTRRDELGDLARDFNRLAEALARNQQLRQSMTADISHELRTPIATLRAELEAMEDGIRPVTQTAITRLQSHLGRLQRLVDDLYQLSLADAGALDYRFMPLDLGALLQEIGAQWAPRFNDAGLRLYSAPAQQAVPIVGDRTRLTQAVENLLENTLRYTEPPGQAELTLSVTGDQAVMILDDSPPGITGDDHDRLFTRLFRAETSRSHDSGGAGLGLALVERLITAHQGTVTAGASPLGGLRIRITLPLEPRRAS